MKWEGRTYRRQKKCVVCGAVIPYYKRSYCSEECQREALKRRARNDRKTAKELGIPYDDYVKEKR
jgi:predicted nucleic acid-binding Zn ribbon protein